MLKTILSVALFFIATVPAAAAGKLLIVGGGLSPDNEPLHRAFLTAIPSDRKLAIISAASGSPIESARLMKQDFVRYGFDQNSILHIHLAVMDDKSTELDESQWQSNGDNEVEIERLKDVGGVWFTGGDQARILATLRNQDGTDKAMAKRLRAILDEGGIIGGTSAGAAMMSEDMILFGDPLPTLLYGKGPDGSGKLGMGKGMGFLPIGLVDQHFDERRRLGRLARAISYLPPAARTGFGIDENTGFLVDLDDLSMQVVGEGALTILDGRSAEFGVKGDALAATNLVVHILTNGDTYKNSALRPASYKQPTVGNEYNRNAQQSGSGIAAPYPGIARYLGTALLDNSASGQVSAISFADNGQGIRYVFNQVPSSQGFWGRDNIGRARYSIFGVQFSIKPINVTITGRR